MDTSKVTNMSQMFSDCRSLKKLDLSSFDTNKVEDMSKMFSGCSDLKLLNITNFDTSKVTNMNGMFSGCETLEELDLSSFDTTNVKSMNNMFESTESLKSLKLGEKFVVPEHQEKKLNLTEKTWINIGNGTINNPKPTDKSGISSTELLTQADKGQWVVKPDQEYHGLFTVQVNNNLNEKLEVEVPEEVRPDYVGSIFEIAVPKKDGYTADKKTISVMTLKNKLSSVDAVSYTAVKETPVVAKKVIQSVEKKAISEEPKTAGKIIEEKNYVAIHPDYKNAKVYDVNGQPRKHVLSQGEGWLSDKTLKIAKNTFYHLVGDDWVKADDVYLYQNAKNRVKTRNVFITGLVNTHADKINNRGLGALSTWDTDKVAMINNHKYYQVSEDEFVDSKDVDVVNG